MTPDAIERALESLAAAVPAPATNAASVIARGHRRIARRRRAMLVVAAMAVVATVAVATRESRTPSPAETAALRPGGVIGCPILPITPSQKTDPPPGLVRAAVTYIRFANGWANGAVTATYQASDAGAGVFGDAIGDNVRSCGQAIADLSWVVEMSDPRLGTDGGIFALVLAHSADGWHVYGGYPAGAKRPVYP